MNNNKSRLASELSKRENEVSPKNLAQTTFLFLRSLLEGLFKT